ncbi:MAG: nitroreductase family protein [Pseudomonadales bacterium]
MSQLNLSNDELLSTTRAVRKRLDFDREVPRPLIDECMNLALQAPSGSNAQGWQFMFVNDKDKIAKIGELYRVAFAGYAASDMAASKQHADDPSMHDTQQRVQTSAQYLADNMHRVPLMMLPCYMGRLEAVPTAMMNASQAGTLGSIIPAAWSFMLAARARGLGTCWTTLHLNHEKEIAEILGIPYDSVTQVALIPVGYTKGTDFKVAPRKPLETVVHFNQW